jgi:ribonuclease E
LSNETFALKIIKLVELKSIENKSKIIRISVNEKICQFIKENYVGDINYFKKKNKVEINIFSNNSLDCSDYIIEFFSKKNKILEKIEKISVLKKIINLKQEIKEKNNKKFKKKIFYKKKYFKKKTI